MTSAAPAPTTAPAGPKPIGPVTLQQVKDSWPEILEVVKNAKLNAWLVVYTAQPLELRDGKVLVLSFPSQKDVEELKKPASPGQGVGDLLKKAFVEVLGLEPALIARVDANAASPAGSSVPAQAPTAAGPASTGRAATGPGSSNPDEPPFDDVPPPDDFPPTDSQGWAVAAIPYTETTAPEVTRTKPALIEPPARTKPGTGTATGTATPTPGGTQPAAAQPAGATQPAAGTQPTAPTAAPAQSPTKPAPTAVDNARYGESVVRELLGASFIEEQPVAPRVVPRPEG